MDDSYCSGYPVIVVDYLRFSRLYCGRFSHVVVVLTDDNTYLVHIPSRLCNILILIYMYNEGIRRSHWY